MVLGLGAVIGGELISSLEVYILEFVILPSLWSASVNIVTILGVFLGLLLGGLRLKRWELSTLFFLTPLVYRTPKIFSRFIDKLGVLDYG